MKKKSNAGRKESSVWIDGDRIKEILADKRKTITDLSNAIGYARSGVSTSINNNRMDVGMLTAIGEELDVAPCLIRHTNKKSVVVIIEESDPIIKTILGDEYKKPFEGRADYANGRFFFSSDFEDIPIRYYYKQFPYSYEKVNDLNSTELLRSLLDSWEIPNGLSYIVFKDFENVLRNLTVDVMDDYTNGNYHKYFDSMFNMDINGKVKELFEKDD